jgi:hypothetical protein
MVQQVFQPVAYLALLALLASYLERRFALRRPLFAGIAVLCAFGFVVGLEYNRRLAALSNYEQGLTHGLKQLVPVITRTTRFFVRLDKPMVLPGIAAEVEIPGINDDWYAGRNPDLNRILIKQAYKARRPNDITLDAIYKGEGGPAAMVTLGPDEKGIYSPSVGAYVPYAEAVFAAYDGVTVTALKTVDRTTFAGFKVRFDRADAWRGEAQSSALPGLLAFDFDTTPPGSGWSVPQRSAGGESFVWMAAESATITIGPVPAGATEVGFRSPARRTRIFRVDPAGWRCSGRADPRLLGRQDGRPAGRGPPAGHPLRLDQDEAEAVGMTGLRAHSIGSAPSLPPGCAGGPERSA